MIFLRNVFFFIKRKGRGRRQNFDIKESDGIIKESAFVMTVFEVPLFSLEKIAQIFAALHFSQLFLVYSAF